MKNTINSDFRERNLNLEITGSQFQEPLEDSPVSHDQFIARKSKREVWSWLVNTDRDFASREAIVSAFVTHTKNLMYYHEQATRAKEIYININKIAPFHSNINDDLEELIEKSKWILDLQDNWDDEGASGFSEESFTDVVKFLRSLSRTMFLEYNIRIPMPTIGPSANSAFSIRWKTDSFILIVLFRKDRVFEFYGDQLISGINMLKGEFEYEKFIDNKGFMLWFYNLLKHESDRKS